jgi:hypothetical protein
MYMFYSSVTRCILRESVENDSLMMAEKSAKTCSSI